MLATTPVSKVIEIDGDLYYQAMKVADSKPDSERIPAVISFMLVVRAMMETVDDTHTTYGKVRVDWDDFEVVEWGESAFVLVENWDSETAALYERCM